MGTKLEQMDEVTSGESTDELYIERIVGPDRVPRRITYQGLVNSIGLDASAAIAAVNAAGEEQIAQLMLISGANGYLERPETVFASGVTGWWLWGWDATQMTVNSDGTGGQPASLGTFGRWLDKSGNGNYILQATAANQLIYRGGVGAAAFHATETTERQAFMKNETLSTSIPRTNASGGFVVSVPGANVSSIFDMGNSNLAFFVGSNQPAYYPYLNWFYETAPNYVYTTLPWTSRKMVVVWEATESILYMRVNGVGQSFATPFGAQLMSELHLAAFNGGAPQTMVYHELVSYNSDIGIGRLIGLENYLNLQAGPRPDPNSTVHIFGDSLSAGVGSEIGKAWHEYCTNRSTSTWTSLSRPGGFLHSPHVTASVMASLGGSTEGVAIIYAGTNDIASGLRTGAALEADLATFAGTLKTAGRKVIVATLQHFATNNAERIAFNAAQKANYLSYADAIVKLDEDVRLDDATDAAYFTDDGVHFNDAGHAVVGSLFNDALTALA